MARRQARTRLIELKKGETFGSQRGSRGPDRAGTRRRQPQRPQAAEGDARLDPDQAAQADRGDASGALPRQGLRQRRGQQPGRRLQAHTAYPHPRRRDRREDPNPRLARPPLGRRSQPLMAEPLPSDPHPLVKERREPPRPPPTRQRPHRLQKSTPRRRPSGIGP